MKIIEFFGIPGVGKTTTLDTISGLFNPDFVTKNEINRMKGSIILDAMLKRDTKLKVFLDNINESLHCSKSPALSVYSCHLDRTLKNFVFFRYYNDDRFLLLDGGLCQRGLTLSLCEPSDSSYIEKYYRLMPEPFAIIAFENTVKTVVKRNNSRNVKWNFASKAGSLSLVYKIGKDILIERGIPILTINTKSKPEHNAQKIISFSMGLK